jgi:hypothetical protein
MDLIRSLQAQMPVDTYATVCKSAVASFVLGTLFTNSSQTGLILGAVAATASFVHALTTPLFRQLLQKNTLNWQENVVRTVATLALTSCLLNNLTTLRVDLLKGIIRTVALSLVFNGLGNQSINRNSLYIFF